MHVLCNLNILSMHLSSQTFHESSLVLLPYKDNSKVPRVAKKADLFHRCTGVTLVVRPVIGTIKPTQTSLCSTDI